MYRPSPILFLLLLSLALACESASEGGTPDVYAPAEVVGAPDVVADIADVESGEQDVEAGVASAALLPDEHDFGAVTLGTTASKQLIVRSTGSAPLVVTRVYFDAAVSSASFTVEHGEDVDVVGEITPDNPLVVPTTGYRLFLVRFAPTQAAELGEDLLPIDEMGTLVVESESETPRVEMAVRGYARPEGECPIAIIFCDEGREVTPQTNLHLRGDGSYPMMGEVRKWEWQVEQPVGSQSVFLPSSTFPNPTFEVNVAGTYTFYLRVWDEENTQSCAPAEYEVVVIPDEAIHVELTWTTPNDPDETDTGPFAGANVDLHFLHPDAPDERYFTDPYDCYWANPHPDWGTPDDTDDDPRLDRDDTDGAGPENINLTQPETDARYEVAVHYPDDHGYGTSFVTVRVYIYSNLEWEIANVRLIDGDLWSVCTIDWPSGTVTQVSDPDGGYLITRDYPFSEAR